MKHLMWIWVGAAVVACGSPAPRGAVPATGSAGPEQTAATAEPIDPIVAELNLDFEAGEAGKPDKWHAGGEGYAAAVDDANPQAGARSLRLSFVEAGKFGMASSQFPLERARGKRLKLTGYVRTADIERGYAGLWMRVDGPNGKTLAFDNMRDRGVTGTTEWTEYEVVLNVSQDATGIMFGALLTGNGTMWVDTLRFEVLGDAPSGPAKLSGAVVDADGKPVAGALVALMRQFSDVPTAMAVSDEAGAFALIATPGRYAITASAPGVRGARIDERAFGEGEVVDDLRLTVGGEAFTHTGTLVDEAGKPVAGALVGLSRLTFETGYVWFTRTAEDGSFALTVMPTDRYVATVQADGLYTDYVGVDGNAARTVELVALRQDPAPDAVVEWIEGAAVPLASVEAGHGFDDMKPLRKVVGNARVVALGEATHGTREFFQMKHRVLEFLVEKMGFTVFAIEANFTESLAVNDYVLNGTGDARTALEGIYFWTWDTEEVLELIEWMRAYNADPAHKKKVKFYGFDMQVGRVAAEQLLAYFETVDPEYANTVADQLGKMQKEDYLRSEAASLGEHIAGFERRLDDHRKAYVNKSDLWSWQVARQNARVLAQQRKMNVAGDGEFDARDEAMAANLQWILDVEPKGTRVVAWAHNGHVGKGGFYGLNTMGVHLKEALGRKYVVFGFAFNRGGFQAIDMVRGGLQGIEVGPAPADTVGATFARAGCSICVLDLRRARRRSPAANWLARPLRMRNIGAVYSTDEEMLMTHDLPANFDAVIFVDQTTRARPVKRD